MSDYPEISVEDRAEQPYVGATAEVTMDHFAPVADQLPEIIGWLAGQGLTPAGPPFFRYRLFEAAGGLVVQAGVPTGRVVADAEGFETDVLPAGRYVTTTYTGVWDDLITVTEHLLQWAADQGLTFDQHHGDEGAVWGARLESFETNPLEVPDPAQHRTTLAFRLAG